MSVPLILALLEDDGGGEAGAAVAEAISLATLYEEVNYKTFHMVVAIAGHWLVPNARSQSHTFSMGQTPTCSFEIDNPVPAYVTEDASVVVWHGFNGLTKEVFNGTIESVSRTDTGVTIQCSGQMKKLSAPFKQLVSTTGSGLSTADGGLLSWLQSTPFVAPNPGYAFGLQEDSSFNIWSMYRGILPLPNGAFNVFTAVAWLAAHGVPGFIPTELIAFLNTSVFDAPNAAYNYGLQEDSSHDVWLVWHGQSPAPNGAFTLEAATAWLLEHGAYAVSGTAGAALSAQDLVNTILIAAGVTNKYVNLGPWVPGTVVQQPLQFQTYADAVNTLAEPFGSPAYEMPNGQIRVELRDPIPAPGYFRQYFVGMISADGSVTQPSAIANALSLPRIRSISANILRREVYNKIIVRGASIPQTGPEGEENSILLETTAFATSPWIPPINGVDQYNELPYQSELLDVPQDLATVALRYLDLYNRLIEELNVSIDGDPEIALGMTVYIADPQNTGISFRYFVSGYTTSVSDNDYVTELTLRGGRAAGSTPHIAPFANFTWRNQYSQIPPAQDNQSQNSISKSSIGSKVQQFVPTDALADDDPGVAGQRVLITFDASPSFDPDGRIVAYSWRDNYAYTRSGKRVTLAYDPDAAGSIEMTLTVFDNEGLSATVTQTVNINTFGPSDGYITGEDAGGNSQTVSVMVVGDGIAGISSDGAENWNLYDAAFSGSVIGVVAYGPLSAVLFLGEESGLITLDGGVTWTVIEGLGETPADVISLTVSNDNGEFSHFQVLATSGHVYTSEVSRLLNGGVWDAYPLSPSRLPGYESAAAPTDSFTNGRMFAQYILGASYLWVEGEVIFGATNRDLGVIEGNSVSVHAWTKLKAYTAPPTPSFITAISDDGDVEFIAVPSPVDTDGPVVDIQAESGMEGTMLLADAGKIYKTIDGGDTVGEVFVVADHPETAGGTIIRISTQNVPSMAPDADLYEIGS